jgi:energy-coupling factor transport system permease protein
MTGGSATGPPHRGTSRRIPRALHPVAWWLWAISLAVAATAVTDPIVLLLILGVLAVVVVNRRTDAPWARAFRYYVVLALTVVAIRVAFLAVFGGDVGGPGAHVLFTLPRLPLPSWAAGVRLGGSVTVEGTLGALYAGLRLGCLLCCLGAANSLANPKRALRVLPGALYELGVAVVVSLSVAPQLVESVQRVRRARKLRGGPTRGFHALRGVAIPVLEDALDRSIRLAAAMDSRGYGRSSGASAASRRWTAVLLVGGMGGLCLGAYGLLDGSVAGPAGVPSLIAGGVLCGAGLLLGGRRVVRSQYRPDPWKLAEWGVVACGLVPAVVLVAGLAAPAGSLDPSTDPLVWPSLPLVPALAVLVAGLAAVIAPPPVRAARRVAVAGGEDAPLASGSAATGGTGRRARGVAA